MQNILRTEPTLCDFKDVASHLICFSLQVRGGALLAGQSEDRNLMPQPIREKLKAALNTDLPLGGGGERRRLSPARDERRRPSCQRPASDPAPTWLP